MKFIYLVLTISLISCQEKNNTDNKSKSLDTNKVEIEKVNIDGSEKNQTSLSENGEFIFGQNEYIYFDELNSEYGILITEHEFDDIDETYYELFYKSENKIFKTSDVQKLKEQLAKLPNGTDLNWYDTCTFSRMRGLSDKKKKAFIDICTELGIHLIEPSWEESRNIKCYCGHYP